MQFINPILQKTFEQKGFVVIDLLDENELSALEKIYEQFPGKRVADFQVSNYEKDALKNQKVDRAIKDIISEKIALQIKDYRLLSGFFYIKYPGVQSEFHIHKDWNLVDESVYSSIHVWIPLTDTDRHNGNLFFCPFDFNKKISFRGSPGFEYPEPDKLTNFVNRFYKVDVYTKKGQAICFRHNLTHGSRLNQTDKPRIAAGISIIPSEAPFIHYHRNKDGEIKKHEVADDFYVDFDLNNYQEIL